MLMGDESIQAMFVLFFPASVPRGFEGFTGYVEGVDALSAGKGSVNPARRVAGHRLPEDVL